jgi:hypothetical protein
MSLPGDNRSVMGFNLIWMFDKFVLLGELLRDLAALELPAPKVGQTFGFQAGAYTRPLLSSTSAVSDTQHIP